MKVGIVVPHIFMQRDILQQVIFSPAALALSLVNELWKLGVEVTLFTSGPVDTVAINITADLSYFERELAGRGDTYLDLLKKHPFTFITLARQVQAELIAAAYAMANAGGLDIVHIYTNEEDIALPFAKLCSKPVVFTHHDPFNFLVKYKNNLPKYAHLNWVSLSYAQRKGMPGGTNWVANIYHGLPTDGLRPVTQPTADYVAYMGRIIEPKGVHLAVEAVEQYNRRHPALPLTLRIAGKHYTDKKDSYWQEHIVPRLSKYVQYIGFVDGAAKQVFLGNARVLIVPSIFEEPFGVVMIEALACGTPVIGLDSGAIPEIITDPRVGTVVNKRYMHGELDETATALALATALESIDRFNRSICRTVFGQRFTATRMAAEHAALYERLRL